MVAFVEDVCSAISHIRGGGDDNEEEYKSLPLLQPCTGNPLHFTDVGYVAGGGWAGHGHKKGPEREGRGLSHLPHTSLIAPVLRSSTLRI